MKKRRCTRILSTSSAESLSDLSSEEICDICAVLAKALPEEVKVILNDMGIKISNIPKYIKQFHFSNISTSRKHRYKDQILKMFEKYNDVSAGHTFSKLFLSTAHCWANKLEELRSSYGITIDESLIPPSLRISQGIEKVKERVSSLGTLDSEQKIIKVAVMSETVKESLISTTDRGCMQSLASSFGVHKRTAKRVILGTGEGKSSLDMLQKAKRNDVNNTKWPEIVRNFCLTKPICREAPGESVSVGYGERAENSFNSFQ